MAHRRGSFRRGGISDSQRRKKTWSQVKVSSGGTQSGTSLFVTSIRMTTAATSATSGATTADLIAAIDEGIVGNGDEQSTLPDECTLLRARGSLLFPKNVPGTGSLTADNYAWGFGVTDIRSLVNGQSPGPIVDADWDGWMFLRQSAVSPVDSEGTMVDVKAMRKIQTGDALFFAAQAVNGSSAITPQGDWQFDMRFLILLP